MESRLRFIVSLDLGSTYSGYAFCIEEDRTEHPHVSVWQHPSGGKRHKTETALLFDDNKLLGYGFNASELIGSSSSEFFRYFKKSDNETEVCVCNYLLLMDETNALYIQCSYMQFSVIKASRV